MPDEAPRPPIAGAAFLIAQLGAHASGKYAERVAVIDLTPAHTGLLRLVAMEPGMNQQTLATMLGVTPSKVVALVDELESRGLIERRRNESDRRAAALHLTRDGRSAMDRVRDIARAHEFEVTTALDETERAQLVDLLQRVADQQGLTPGVHPGYRTRRS